MSARFNPREEPEKPSKLEKPPEKVPEKEPEAAPEPVKYCEEEELCGANGESKCHIYSLYCKL